MNKFTLFIATLFICVLQTKAQTVATFDDLTLAHADTFYSNHSMSGSDAGFNDGLAHFPYYWDSAFGGYWDHGFVYSNMTDSVTSGIINQFAAKTAIGFGGSTNYAVAYGATNVIILRDSALGRPVSGFYITNATYAYNSMHDGDAFAHKFHSGDWFKVTVQGFRSGILQPDTVNFYLADFRFADTNSNYIIKTWQWVDLLPLGHVDSIQLQLTSSDTGAFGMNTPAYFCIDNFTTNEHDLSVAQNKLTKTEIYPNPAQDFMNIAFGNDSKKEIQVVDVSGKIVATLLSDAANLTMNTSYLKSGLYLMTIKNENKTEKIPFIKE